ncbi:MAG TPA: radical SAM family heme chaperone HemW, partial [Acidimicrobiia bacterium]|nr:radical SAM family heme chaperone HemW [Acidimicrobiia bacterium]
VHVPFCATRCDYCDFATWTDREHLVGQYVDACITDIGRQFAGPRFAGRAADTIFVGGGTPSLLAGPTLARLLEAIPRAPDAEVTVECNPDSVDVTKLAVYRLAGVNRLSLGVQSMRPHVLAALGRTHDPDNVHEALDAARALGFERVNLDLIFGAAGETMADWGETLDAAVALEPDHVSAYALTVVPSTPLGRSIAAGATPATDDDDLADKYHLAEARLAAAGLDWYEISNWSRPGRECRHNLVTWSGGDYVAIGCAAHGHRRGERWWNVRTPERYIEAVTSDKCPRAGSECLDARQRSEEVFSLGLRTRSGATVAAAAAGEVSALVRAGLLISDASRARATLSPAGRLLADDITARLLLAGAAGRP